MNTTESIWNQYSSSLLAFIRGRVNDKSAANDILQDIFIRIHSKLDTLEDTNKLKSWLYQITRNAIIDYYRSHRTTIELPDWLENPEPSNEENVKKDLSSCLIPMIRKLPEKYRQAVYLSEIEELNQSVIADIENISLSGAKSRVQRGKALLKNMLDDCCAFEINKNNQLVDYQYKDNDSKFC